MLRRSMLALVALGVVLAGCGAPKKSAPGPGVGNAPPPPGQVGSLKAGQAPSASPSIPGGSATLGNAPGGMVGK